MSKSTQSIESTISTGIASILAIIKQFLKSHPKDMTIKNVISLLSKDEEFQNDLQEGLLSLVASLPAPKKLKDPNAPKKALSGYQLRSKEIRKSEVEKLQAEGADVSPSAMMKHLSALWIALPAVSSGKGASAVVGKDRYLAMSEKLKKAYAEEMKSYEAPSDAELMKLPINNKKTRAKGKGTGKPKVKRPPGYPKGAKNSRIFFLADEKVKAKVAERLSTDDLKEIREAMIETWNEMKETPTKKKKWVKMAEEDKARHAKEMAKWKADHPEEASSASSDAGNASDAMDEDDATPVIKKSAKTTKPDSEAPAKKTTKAKVEAKVESDDSEADEPVVPTPPKKTVKVEFGTKAKEKAKVKEPESDDSEADEPTPPPTKKKTTKVA